MGDRVKVTGPLQTSSGIDRAWAANAGDYATIVAPKDQDGDVRIRVGSQPAFFFAASSLTMAEPATEFEVGDRVKITGSLRLACGKDRSWAASAGDLATVVAPKDQDGDVRIEIDSSGYSIYFDADSLTKVEPKEPRVFQSLRDVPLDVLKVKDNLGVTYTRIGGSRWNCSQCGEISENSHGLDAPYAEVLND